MRKERIIKITDTETLSGGEDTIEVTTRGYLRGDENDYSLHYEEHFGDGLISKTVISVKNKKTASIIRNGSINTEMMIEAGKRHNCNYKTPYGDMNIGVFAREIQSTITKDGGELMLNYTIDFNGSLGSHKKMLINVSKEIQQNGRG